MNNSKIVFKNTFFLTVSEIFLKLIGVVWIIFLAHNLSVVDYGKYNFVNSFIAIFAFLPDLGIGLIVIREIAKKRSKAAFYIGNTLILNTILAFFTFVLIFVTRYFATVNTHTNFLILIAASTLFISTVRSVAILFFEGSEKMGITSFLNTVNYILVILFAFLMLKSGANLDGVFAGMLIGTIISLFVSWSFLLRFLKPKITFDIDTVKYFVMQGLPLGIAAFAFTIYSRIDSIILGNLLGDSSVGIYNAATPFAFSLMQLLNMPFLVAVYPALSRIGTKDRKRFNRVAKKSLFVIALWSIPAATVISLFARYMIPLIFGEKYETAIPILEVLIFFVPFASLSALLYKILIILEKQKVYLYVSISGAFLSVVLNFGLIPIFGIFGAAYSAVLTQVILFSIYLLFVTRFLKKQ